MMCPDNYDMFKLQQAEWDRREAQLPECDCCGNRRHRYVELFGHIVCEGCIEDSWQEAEIY